MHSFISSGWLRRKGKVRGHTLKSLWIFPSISLLFFFPYTFLSGTLIFVCVHPFPVLSPVHSSPSSLAGGGGVVGGPGCGATRAGKVNEPDGTAAGAEESALPQVPPGGGRAEGATLCRAHQTQRREGAGKREKGREEVWSKVKQDPEGINGGVRSIEGPSAEERRHQERVEEEIAKVRS